MGQQPAAASSGQAPPDAARTQGLAVAPLALPNGARAGDTVTAAFQARPGATCQLTLKGASTHPPFPPAVADAAGRVQWTWMRATSDKPGDATAWVGCSGGAIAQAKITFG